MGFHRLYGFGFKNGDFKGIRVEEVDGVDHGSGAVADHGYFWPRSRRLHGQRLAQTAGGNASHLLVGQGGRQQVHARSMAGETLREHAVVHAVHVRTKISQ